MIGPYKKRLSKTTRIKPAKKVGFKILDQKVDDLRKYSKPIDQHELTPGFAQEIIPERVGENQYHGYNKTVYGSGFHHSHADK